jgi:hypothetical protein
VNAPLLGNAARQVGRDWMKPSRGLRFEESRFWITHRRREYGPFDYEWSADLYGVELTYQGRKFGEICSEREIYADLQGFGLPARVAEVASIVSGCLLFAMLNGLSGDERRSLLQSHLLDHGCSEYLADPN